MAAGDIGIVGFSADQKSFAFVVLVNYAADTVIHFTDNGWLSGGGFRTGEGTLSITIPAGTALGTVIHVSNVNLASAAATTASGTSLTLMRTGTLDPAQGGDQILAYTGSAASPEFLFAVDFADSNTSWATTASNTNTSAVPTGLVDGQTALAFGPDIGSYSGSTSGTRDEILARLASASNWTFSESVAPTYPGNFTVSGGTPSLSITDVTQVETNAGTTTFSFTVSLSAAAQGDVTFTIATADNSATSASGDYVTKTLSNQTIAAGSTSYTFDVTVNGDMSVEEAETFFVNVTAVTGANVVDGQGTGTIQNDDAAALPAVSIADASVTEGNSGTANLTFTVTLSAAASGTVTVQYATADGSAVAGSDYAANQGTVTFAAGETSKSVTVTVNGDTEIEGSETLTVTLSNPSGATLGDGSATGTILTDDSLASPLPWINEFHYDDAGTDTGEFIEIAGLAGTNLSGYSIVLYNGSNNSVYDTIALSGVIPNQQGGFGTLSFARVLQNGSPDAIALVGPNGVVEFISYEGRLTAADGPAAGMTSVDVGFEEPGDAEGTSIGRVGTGSEASAFTWALLTDDTPGGPNTGQSFTPPSPRVSVSDVTVTEGNDGTVQATFTLTRSVTTGAFTVDYTTADGTARAGFDYTATSGTVTFAENQSTATVTVTVTGDTDPEADETFFLNLSNPSGATIGDGQGQGTITNEDGAPPLVTINDVTQDEGQDGSSTMTFTVTRTGGTGAFTVDYVTAGGTATANQDYSPTTGTLSFAENEMSQTVTVTVAGDTTRESNETFQVQLYNPTGFAVLGDAVGIGTIANDDLLFISDVQGSSYFSPILAAEGITAFNTASQTTVTVRAVITALDADGARQGFYITEEKDDWDLSAATSEGIFVMTRNDGNIGTTLAATFPGLKVGDLVTVTAQVMEYQSFTTMPRTTLVNSTVTVNGSGLPLPTMVLDASRPIPNSILTGVTPDYTDSSDDADDSFDASLYALSFWESVEGMLVTIPDMVVADGFVQTSGGQPYFKAYSTVHADADQINSRGGYTVAGDPPLSPPDTAETDDGTTQGGRHLHDGDVNPDIIEVDFTGFAVDAPAGLATTATMGDKLGTLTGILENDFKDIKLFVTSYDPAAITNTQPVQETTALGGDTRALTVATFNVENLDPGDGAARFAAIANAIATNLNAPDIISIEEMQDNNGATNTGGSDASVTWQMLVDALNAKIPGAKYQWVDQAPVPNSEGGEPGGNIRVGFLYNTNRVQLGDLAADATIAERRQYTDRIGDGIRDAGDKIAFSDDMVAGEINTADWAGTRLSLLGQFTFNGNTVYVTANHWPAKGGSGEFWQLNQNLESGDPENSGWAKRNAVAQDVYAVLNLIESNSNGAGIVAAGDFNDFYFYRPLEVVTGYVLPDGTVRSGGARFDNLTVTELAEAERYTYTFDGRSQAIDHVIVNQTLSAVATYDIVHLNTGYNENGTGADANPAISDHDPAIASFDFRSFGETLFGTAGNDQINGEGGNDTISLQSGGNDAASGGEGNDLIYYGDAFTNDDSNDGGAGFDRVGLLGNYTLTFDADDLVGIERLELYGSTRFTGQATSSYELTTIDANVAAGTRLIVTAASLVGTESLKFSGKAETDGSFSVQGGGGADRIGGGQLADLLIGNGGADQLFGYGGDDYLVGGGGADMLRGGFGRDVYRYLDKSDSGTAEGTSDRILDFERTQDRIDLSFMDAGSAEGDQAFTFIGEANFTNTGQGQVRSTFDSAENAWRVEGDVDGDGTADFAILVFSPNPTPLNASDFIL